MLSCVPVYYVEMNAVDSIRDKQRIPSNWPKGRYAVAVEATDLDAARALIQNAYSVLAPEKDFGEPKIAEVSNGCWVMSLEG